MRQFLEDLATIAKAAISLACFLVLIAVAFI